MAYVCQRASPEATIYISVWTPHEGEQLQLKYEEGNNNDPRAVAVV